MRRKYRLGRGGKYFPNRLKRRRRFQVSVRPKIRLFQWGERLALTSLLFAGGAAVMVLRQNPLGRIQSLNFERSIIPSSLLLNRAVLDGVPDVLRDLLIKKLGPDHSWTLTEPSRAVRLLLAEFPCLRDVRYTRDWAVHTVKFHAELRRPVARVFRGGRPWGWLSEEGILFTVPDGVLSESRNISVDVGRGGESQAKALAKFASLAQAEQFLPSPVLKMEFVSEGEGWRVTLEDRTSLIWGDLNWTSEKAVRLKEVLSDSRAHGRADWSADLRYFGEGKILTRPNR